MIFVTVGTTYFDELIREVDRLAGEGIVHGPVIAQIGRSRYIPRHIQWVRYVEDMDQHYHKADLVISHGGVGTLFELLLLQKSFIAVANRSLPGDHQAQLLRVLAARGLCRCCFQVGDLEAALREQATRPLVPYQRGPELPEAIWDFVATPVREPKRVRPSRSVR
jgi:beta-1,4-N-acetylglucosaminyltransferase